MRIDKMEPMEKMSIHRAALIVLQPLLWALAMYAAVALSSPAGIPGRYQIVQVPQRPPGSTLTPLVRFDRTTGCIDIWTSEGWVSGAYTAGSHPVLIVAPSSPHPAPESPPP